jgi:O-antigen ligase
VALTVTLSRNAWVGACFAVALLFVLRDLRLLAVVPVAAAVFFALAPPQVIDRVQSAFDLKDPTNRDRLAMARSGAHMIQDHPVFGVGPDMITRVYAQYRDPDAVEPLNPHLHNVPLQIAAERGLPALLVWLGFIAVLVRDQWRRLRTSEYASRGAGGRAGTAAMLAAGMFEYNFGDSEFLMLFLVLITLPYAADRPAEEDLAR